VLPNNKTSIHWKIEVFNKVEQEGGFSNFLEEDIELLMMMFSAMR